MFAAIRGHQAWYELEGSAGSPVLLIMGFGMSGRAWAPQVKDLQRHHRVAFYDNRGIGQSGRTQGAQSLDGLADDAAGLLDHLGWDDAHVVGVSMGGMVAQELALRHTRRIRSLTLIATHPGGKSPSVIPSARGLQLFLKANTSRGPARLEALRHLLYPAHVQQQMRAHADVGGESLDAFAIPADRATAINQLRAILKHDTTRRLPLLRGTSVLIVRPDLDLLVPAPNSDRMHALIPHSTLLSFRDAGHGVTHQCAPQVNRHLLAHFAEVDERQRVPMSA